MEIQKTGTASSLTSDIKIKLIWKIQDNINKF